MIRAGCTVYCLCPVRTILGAVTVPAYFGQATPFTRTYRCHTTPPILQKREGIVIMLREQVRLASTGKFNPLEVRFPDSLCQRLEQRVYSFQLRMPTHRVDLPLKLKVKISQ